MSTYKCSSEDPATKEHDAVRYGLIRRICELHYVWEYDGESRYHKEPIQEETYAEYRRVNIVGDSHEKEAHEKKSKGRAQIVQEFVLGSVAVQISCKDHRAEKTAQSEHYIEDARLLGREAELGVE